MNYHAESLEDIAIMFDTMAAREHVRLCDKSDSVAVRRFHSGAKYAARIIRQTKLESFKDGLTHG